MTNKIAKTDEQWRAQLSEEEFFITRQKGTERPFSGKYNNCKTPGVYCCVCCGEALFSSSAKYDSGSGWPSFTAAVSPAAAREAADNSLAMTRTEVLCARCDAHLGHVFPDGPPAAGGRRFCINSAALRLQPQEPAK